MKYSNIFEFNAPAGYFCLYFRAEARNDATPRECRESLFSIAFPKDPVKSRPSERYSEYF